MESSIHRAMTERLATLYEIGQTINSSLDLDVVLDTVMDKVIEVSRAQRGFLMLHQEDGALRVAVARGLNKEDLDNPDFQYSKTVVNEVAESRKAVVTNNAEHDPRFAGGQSIVTMGLRSIMCAPIMVKERLIGVVYVDNSLRAGVFGEDDLALLSAFAVTAGIAIDNARLHRVELENARRERELAVAHNIQRSLIPARLPALPGYEIAAYWRSAREVAGDFYDAFSLGDASQPRLGLIVADVSDKGMSAALFMASSRSLIRGNAIAAHSPQETIAQANRLIMLDSESSGMFVTAYYTVFEPGGRATGINAGHNLPLLFRQRSGEISYLPKGGWALGWFDDMPLTPCDIQLEAGDILVYYTDGLTEAENNRGDFFGNARLEDAVRASAGQSASAVLEHIRHSEETFVGDAPPFDDLTLVVVRYSGS